MANLHIADSTNQPGCQLGEMPNSTLRLLITDLVPKGNLHLLSIIKREVKLRRYSGQTNLLLMAGQGNNGLATIPPELDHIQRLVGTRQ